MINLEMPDRAIELHEDYCFNILNGKISLEELDLREVFRKLITSNNYKELREKSEEFGSAILKEDMKEGFEEKFNALREKLKKGYNDEVDGVIASKRKVREKISKLCESFQVECRKDLEEALDECKCEFIDRCSAELNRIFNGFEISSNNQEFISYEKYRCLKKYFMNFCNSFKIVDGDKLKEEWNDLFSKVSKAEDSFISLYESFVRGNHSLEIEITEKNLEIRNKMRTYDIANLESKYWCAYLYTYLLGTSICPYCNSQFVYTYKLDDGSDRPRGTTRAELDHFFPKSQFPFLAMSIHNLIPSCHTCNASIKGDIELSDKILNNINLFSKNNITDKFKFRVRPIENESDIESRDRDAILKCMLGKTSKFEILIEFSDENNKTENDSVEEYLSFFHISERYEFFKLFILESIDFKLGHSNKYLENLNETFKLDYSIYSHSNYKNRLLGKLLDDLSDQFGFEFKNP